MKIKINKRKPETRFLNEMQPVLYDQKWYQSIKRPESFRVYDVYRRLDKKKDLRYDITVIPPQMMGQEFPKTKGHAHSNVQELIWVLEGKAFYFAQKGKGNSVDDCYVIEAKKGDVLTIPFGYQHLTINPSKEKLIMANWISEKAKYDYSLFDRFQGACYYYTTKGWIKNKNYKKIPKLKFKKPSKLMPEDLSFLSKA
jgi:glucose-6-phosphate isomerase